MYRDKASTQRVGFRHTHSPRTTMAACRPKVYINYLRPVTYSAQKTRNLKTRIFPLQTFENLWHTT